MTPSSNSNACCLCSLETKVGGQTKPKSAKLRALASRTSVSFKKDLRKHNLEDTAIPITSVHTK